MNQSKEKTLFCKGLSKFKYFEKVESQQNLMRTRIICQVPFINVQDVNLCFEKIEF